jgi:hypothetical protein
LNNKYKGYYYQEWPKRGILKDNMNLCSDVLEQKIENEFGSGTHYTVKSIIPSQSRDSFIQTGCGPNFEGGIISQCTCRHDIRAKYYSSDEWESKWLAGFTPYSQKRCGGSYLFYLMRIKKTFQSFQELHEHYQNTNHKLIEVKSTENNPLGDLYIPINKDSSACHDPDNYTNSRSDHSHYGETGKLHDINYPKYLQKHKKTRTDKQATLLIGDPEFSFLWNKPIIMHKGGKAPRHKKYSNIQSFFDMLIPVSDVVLPEF